MPAIASIWKMLLVSLEMESPNLPILPNHASNFDQFPSRFDFSGISGYVGHLVINSFKKSPCPVHDTLESSMLCLSEVNHVKHHLAESWGRWWRPDISYTWERTLSSGMPLWSVIKLRNCNQPSLDWGLQKVRNNQKPPTKWEETATYCILRNHIIVDIIIIPKDARVLRFIMSIVRFWFIAIHTKRFTTLHNSVPRTDHVLELKNFRDGLTFKSEHRQEMEWMWREISLGLGVPSWVQPMRGGSRSKRERDLHHKQSTKYPYVYFRTA